MRHLIAILWLMLLGCYIVGYGILLGMVGRTPFLTVMSVVFVAGILSWWYVTQRLFPFRRRLSNFLRHLLAGNYEVGVKTVPFLRDEVRDLTDLLNKAADRLRVYDDLRAERVAFSYRALEAIWRNATDGIIIADMEETVFRFNPAAQVLFGMKQQSVAFDAIVKNDANRDFADFFRAVSETEKTLQERKVGIQVPARDSRRELLVRMVPLKDQREKVRLVFVLLRHPAGAGVHPADVPPSP